MANDTESPPIDEKSAPAATPAPAEKTPELVPTSAPAPFAPAPSAPLAAGPSITDVLAALGGHQELMIQWFNAVRQDLTVVYHRIDAAAAQVVASQQTQARPVASAPPAAAQPAPPPKAEPASAIGEFVNSAAAAIGRVMPQQAAPAAQPASAAHDVLDWERMVFGPELTGAGRITHDRAQLISGLREGDSGAQALAGTLLIFRGSAAEKLPVLLKDIGEAFYRWRPESATRGDNLRDLLIQWLERTCEKNGLMMKIELVRPGDRFDSKRHNAKDPGVEVAEVYGWVVLRDSGKIYTKANVAAR